MGRNDRCGDGGVPRHLRVFQARGRRQGPRVREAADAASRHRRRRMTAATLAKRGLFFAVFALFAVFARPARAQNWDFDARTIGLGGVSGSGTIASGMIEHGAGYRSIVLPFGLLQVLPDLEISDPDSTRFDPVRAVEHAASPIHFIVGRDDDLGDGAFATTIATPGSMPTRRMAAPPSQRGSTSAGLSRRAGASPSRCAVGAP